MGDYPTRTASIASSHSPRSSNSHSASRPISPFGFGSSGPSRRRSLGYVDGQPVVVAVRNRDSASSNSASHYRLGRYRSASEETGLTRNGESPDSSVNGWSEGEKDRSVEGSPREREWDDGRRSAGASSLKVVEEGTPISSWGDIEVNEEGIADNAVRGPSGREHEHALEDDKDDSRHSWTASTPVIELSLASPPQAVNVRRVRPHLHSRNSLDNDADDEGDIMRDSPEAAPMSPPPTFPLPGLPDAPDQFRSPSPISSSEDSEKKAVPRRRLPGDATFGAGYDDGAMSPRDTRFARDNISPRTTQYSPVPSFTLPLPLSVPVPSPSPDLPAIPTPAHRDAPPPLSTTTTATPSLSPAPSPVPLGTPIVIKSRGGDISRSNSARNSRFSESGRARARTRSAAGAASAAVATGTVSDGGNSPYQAPVLPRGTRSSVELVTPATLQAAYGASELRRGPSIGALQKADFRSSKKGESTPVLTWPTVDDRRNKAVPAAPFPTIPTRRDSVHDSPNDGRSSRASTNASYNRIIREARDPRTQIDRPDPIMRELLGTAPPSVFPTGPSKAAPARATPAKATPAKAAPRVSIATPNPKVKPETRQAAAPREPTPKKKGSRLRSLFGSSKPEKQSEVPPPAPVDTRLTPPRPDRTGSLTQSILLKGGTSDVGSLRSLDHTMPAFDPGSPMDFSLSMSSNANMHGDDLEELDDSKRRGSVSSGASSSMRSAPKPYILPPGLAGALAPRAHATDLGKQSHHLQYIIPTRISSAAASTPARSPRLDYQPARTQPPNAVRDQFRSQFLER
ncbi:hypothetical protein RQP46_006838 [Phenoliferia psychrophenolica]